MSASEGGKIPTVIKQGKTANPWRVVCSGSSGKIERFVEPVHRSQFRENNGCGAELEVFIQHLFQRAVFSYDADIFHIAIFFECPSCKVHCFFPDQGELEPSQFPSYAAWESSSQK